MSCHRQLLPTLTLTLQDGGVSEWYALLLYALETRKGNHQNGRKQTQDLYSLGLSGLLCANIFLCALLQYSLCYKHGLIQRKLRTLKLVTVWLEWKIYDKLIIKILILHSLIKNVLL